MNTYDSRTVISGSKIANVTVMDRLREQEEFNAASRREQSDMLENINGAAECVGADEATGLGISLTNSICHLDTINASLASIECLLDGVHSEEKGSYPDAPDICISDAGLCSASLELEEHLSNTAIRVEQIRNKLQF